MIAFPMCSMGARVDREWWTIQMLGPRLYEWKGNSAQSAGELRVEWRGLLDSISTTVEGEWCTLQRLEWKGWHGPHSKAGTSGLQWGNGNSCKSRTYIQHKLGSGGAFSKRIMYSKWPKRSIVLHTQSKHCHLDIHILNGHVNYSHLINSDFQLQCSQLFRYNKAVFWYCQFQVTPLIISAYWDIISKGT